MNITASRKRSKGAAMLVTLILLLVSTLLGLGVMRGANEEQQLVSNVFFKELSFRAAESASQIMINDTQLLADALEPANENGISETVVLPNNNVLSEGKIKFAGSGLARGFSVGVGNAGFQVYKYDLSGTATVTDVNAATTIAQGVKRLAPAQ